MGESQQKMPTLTKSNNRQVEKGLRSIQTTAPYGQPWWQGLGSNDMPSSGQPEDSTITSATVQLQPQGSVDGISKDTETNAHLHSGNRPCKTTYFTSISSLLYLNILYVYFVVFGF